MLLVGHDNSKTSVSYARYLMSVSLGRYLSRNEHVDHINGNKMDDRIENLQILSQHENNIKSVRENNLTRKTTEFKCPVCGVLFIRASHNYNYRPNFKPTCSRRCGGIKSRIK